MSDASWKVAGRPLAGTLKGIREQLMPKGYRRCTESPAYQPGVDLGRQRAVRQIERWGVPDALIHLIARLLLVDLEADRKLCNGKPRPFIQQNKNKNGPTENKTNAHLPATPGQP
jgi:hypothetical protein